VANGFRQIDGGDRGGEPPAPPFDRARVGYRRSRSRVANDNALSRTHRLWRGVLGLGFAASLLLLAWAALR
jgi:hypothetical protein